MQQSYTKEMVIYFLLVIIMKVKNFLFIFISFFIFLFSKGILVLKEPKNTHEPVFVMNDREIKAICCGSYVKKKK